MTQSILDLHALNKTRASSQNLKATQYTAKDARDLVVLAVGYNYLLAIADISRIESVSAQVNTAQRSTTRPRIRCKPEPRRLSTDSAPKWN